jgi:hypothetical protein
LSTDISKVIPSLSIVPVATGNCADVDLPGGPNCANSNKAYAEWTGIFKGNLVGSKPFTQMTIYTDPALHVGWQQDPNIRANTHVRVEYYFDANNASPDRVEVYTLSSAHGNTFVMLQNKITPYYFGCYAQSANFGQCVTSGPNANTGLYGPDDPVLSPGKIMLDDRFAPAAPFPASVRKGKIKVQVYGQAGSNHAIKLPVPVSVGTSPLLNRASWVQPPYEPPPECSSFADLRHTLREMNLPQRAKEALSRQLKAAAIALDQEDWNTAAENFAAFAKRLDRLQRHGQLDQATADALMACAFAIAQSIVNDE